MKKGTPVKAADRRAPDRAALIECIFNSSPHGIMVFATDGQTVLINDTASRITGYRKEELATVDDTLRRLIPDSKERQETEKLLRGYMTDHAAGSGIAWITTMQGGRMCLQCRITPLGPDHTMISFQPVTDQMLTEEQYHALFEQAPDSILLFDAQSRKIVQFNRMAHETLGYTREEFQAMRLDDFVGPDGGNIIGARVAGILSGKANFFEGRYTKKNGEIIYVEIYARPIHIGAGQYIQSVVRNVTDEKNAQKAIRESEEKFRNLAEQSPNMIFINRGGAVVYANTRCEEIMGYTRQELCSPSFKFMILVAPEFHASTLEYFSRHARGQEVAPYEYVIVTKSGTRIPAVISTKLMMYDGVPAIMGIVTDISELKQAEDSLRRSASKLREKTKELEAKNAALKEVLAQIESEKLEIRRQVTANAEKLLLPVIRKIRARSRDDKLMELLESNLNDLTSRFGASISSSHNALSARETEISNMIRSGLTSKEIATQLGVSLRTVDTYRNRIRKKLSISGRQVNLFTHLQSIS